MDSVGGFFLENIVITDSNEMDRFWTDVDFIRVYQTVVFSFRF